MSLGGFHIMKRQLYGNKSCNFFFELIHPRCVGSITKNFCVLHSTVEHNYISSSSTLGLQPCSRSVLLDEI